jgi:tetratricopeptide (TPR) repeat protein
MRLMLLRCRLGSQPGVRRDSVCGGTRVCGAGRPRRDWEVPVLQPVALAKIGENPVSRAGQMQIIVAQKPAPIADYGGMDVSLQGAPRRAAVLAVAFATAAVLTSQAGKLWLASHRVDSEKPDVVEQGAALVPGNAAAWDRLGRLRQWDFANPDLPGAIADYQRAIQADPRSAHYWMDVASAYEATGDDTRARDAFAHAKAVYPISAEVAFYYGNFLLRQQEYPEGYQELQRAVRTDRTLVPLAISRTWRSSEDVDSLLNQILPADADAYLQALDFFASSHRAESGLAVWKRLLSLRQPILLSRTFPFLEELIREDRGDDARRVWREAVTAAGHPYVEPRDHSLIWNGDFVADSANGGLDWRWVPFPGVSIDFDAEPAPNGSRAVRLGFNGGSNLTLGAPWQYVAVEPGRNYHFHAYMRTQEITTESGMRFSITDPNHPDALNLLTDNFTGSRGWTAVDADLTTGPQTHFLIVRLLRNPSRMFDNKLSGTVWIAGVSLVPSSGEADRTSR